MRDLDFKGRKRRLVIRATVVSQEEKQALKRNETLAILVWKKTQKDGGGR